MRKISVIGLIAVLAALVIIFASCSSAVNPPTAPSPAPGVAARLAFSVQPSGATAGTALTAQPAVIVEDDNGNTVTDFTMPVTLSIASGTGASSAVLFGGNTVRPVNGLAVFKDLSINLAGTGYKLTATSSGLTPAASDSFDIIPGTPAKLVFASQPVGANAGAVFTTPPVVVVADYLGNTVTGSIVPVTLSLTSGAVGFHNGGSSLVLSGTTTVNAVNGVATFADLSVNLAGTGYKLFASSSGLNSDTSDSFDITPGAPVALTFFLNPDNSTAGAVFTTAPVVTIDDANGNVTTSTAPVTIAITTGTGTSGAVLSGTTTLNAAKGVAVFNGLSIDLAGTGYKLTVTSNGLTSVISTAFNVVTG